MKRLLSAALALTLLSATAASAAPRGHGGYSRSYHGGYGNRNAGGALIGLGIGLMALSVLSSSSRYDDPYYDRDYYAPPPPPPRGYYDDRYDRYDDRGYGYGR